MSRVVKHGTRWVVAYQRGRVWIGPAHTGKPNAPLALVGTLDHVAEHGYTYANRSEAVARAAEFYPFDNTAFERRAA